jgi:hypothetical protein
VTDLLLFPSITELLSIVPGMDFQLDSKNGIVVLVTCNYGYPGSIGEVNGPNDDAEEMITTFDELGYFVHHLKNEKATRVSIEDSLQKLCRYLAKYDGRKEKKAIIFAFSGHGVRKDNKEFLNANDGERISLHDDIMPHFVGHQKIFQIPKLFFINACRGKKELQVKQCLAPSKNLNYIVGNYLIAYATITDHVAYDTWWMKNLAIKIRADRYAPLSVTLDDLAKDVKEDLQPEYVSRLRGSFRFC